MTIKITKGLDLSLQGEINHQVLPKVTNLTSRVAVLGKDFHGIRPTMFVSEGQQVSQGEKLFEDKKNPGYFHLSPVNGTISEINRGDRRSFLSMVIEKSNDDATFEISLLPKENVNVGISENNTLDLFRSEKINYHIFSGPHPIGLVGTQIHKISPASLANQIWTIGYQELIKIGKTVLTGYVSNDKYISISGPQVFNPEILLTDFGACVEELTAGKLKEEENRLISGSVLCGHICEGPLAYLSSFSNQLTVIREANQDDREFLNWLRPEIKKHSSLRMFLTSAIKNYKYNLTSALNGGFRAIVPVGVYEDIFPMNLMITQLLKAIVTEDTELAQSLGVLELDEEDLALCTYSCPSKYDYGLILRNILDKIEKDG